MQIISEWLEKSEKTTSYCWPKKWRQRNSHSVLPRERWKRRNASIIICRAKPMAKQPLRQVYPKILFSVGSRGLRTVTHFRIKNRIWNSTISNPICFLLVFPVIFFNSFTMSKSSNHLNFWCNKVLLIMQWLPNWAGSLSEVRKSFRIRCVFKFIDLNFCKKKLFWSIAIIKISERTFFRSIALIKFSERAFFWSTSFIKISERAFFWSSSLIKISERTFFWSSSLLKSSERAFFHKSQTWKINENKYH